MRERSKRSSTSRARAGATLPPGTPCRSARVLGARSGGSGRSALGGRGRDRGEAAGAQVRAKDRPQHGGPWPPRRGRAGLDLFRPSRQAASAPRVRTSMTPASGRGRDGPGSPPPFTLEPPRGARRGSGSRTPALGPRRRSARPPASTSPPAPRPALERAQRRRARPIHPELRRQAARPPRRRPAEAPATMSRLRLAGPPASAAAGVRLGAHAPGSAAPPSARRPDDDGGRSGRPRARKDVLASRKIVSR